MPLRWQTLRSFGKREIRSWTMAIRLLALWLKDDLLLHSCKHTSSLYTSIIIFPLTLVFLPWRPPPSPLITQHQLLSSAIARPNQTDACIACVVCVCVCVCESWRRWVSGAHFEVVVVVVGVGVAVHWARQLTGRQRKGKEKGKRDMSSHAQSTNWGKQSRRFEFLFYIFLLLTIIITLICGRVYQRCRSSSSSSHPDLHFSGVLMIT